MGRDLEPNREKRIQNRHSTDEAQSSAMNDDAPLPKADKKAGFPAPFTGNGRQADSADSARRNAHIATAACSGLSGQRGRADRY